MVTSETTTRKDEQEKSITLSNNNSASGIMIGPVTDAVITSMEIGTTMSTATTVLVAAVAPTLAELAWNEINRSRIRKAAAPSSTTVSSLSNTMYSLRTLRGGGGIGSVVDSKRKTKTGNKNKNITIEPKRKQQSQSSPINDDDNTHNHNKDLATRGKSVAFMALGMALHYLGK